MRVGMCRYVMWCVVIVVVVVLLVASVLASMRWLLCGEKTDVTSMTVLSKKTNKLYLQSHINYTAADLSPLPVNLCKRLFLKVQNTAKMITALICSKNLKSAIIIAAMVCSFNFMSPFDGKKGPTSQ